MGRKKFQYLPHTADIAFVAYGKDLKEAIENAAEAMLNIMLDLKRVNKARAPSRETAIKESAGSIENLVWYTLQNILSRVDERKLSAYNFKIKELGLKRRKYAIKGKLSYKILKEDLFLLEVKAVTPHRLEVKKGRKGYEISILVDV